MGVEASSPIGDKLPTIFVSVRVIDRGESKLEVLIRAKELCQYTLHIAKNEKVFPKRDRWLLTKPIVDYTIFIYTSLMEANEIKVETHDDYVRRRNLQKLALEKCAPLLSLMQIAYENISALDGRRVEHWTGLVIKLKEQLSKWMASDKKRFGDLK